MTDRIQRVSVTHLQVPFKEPLRSREGEPIPAFKDAYLVTIETSGGLGFGESSPPPDVSDLPQNLRDRCWIELTEQVAPDLLGRSFTSPDDIAEVRDAWMVSPYASAGAESACWDLLARSRHATVSDLLSVDPERASVGVESGLAVELYPTVVALLHAIETHMAEGYRRVKLAVRPGRDVEVVRAVRQHFDDLPLMVDAGSAYSASPTDLDVFRALDDLDLLMIEQPLPAVDLDGLAALQGVIETPVCLVAGLEPVNLVVEAIRRGACRVVSLCPQRLGGIGPTQAVHDLCARSGVACYVGTTPELGLGLAAGIHLAALGNCKYPTDIEPSARWFVDDYVAPPIEFVGPGLLPVPTRPGIGHEVDHAKVRHYQVRQVDHVLK